MWLTGEADGPPEFASAPLATAARGAGLALARLAPASPLAGLDAAGLLGERAAIAGLTRGGRTSAGGAARLLEAKDGYVCVHLARPDDWRSVPAWLESAAGLASAEDWRGLEVLVRRRPAAALVERARWLGLAVAPVPHVAPAPIKDASSLPLPFARRLETQRRAQAGEPGRAPRVLDLSSLWAGPLAGSLLAASGAAVLKVESPERPDGARRGPAAFFDLMNAGKSSCALDLNAPADRLVFEQLLEDADIVLESARPRSLEQLGYPAAEWVAGQAGRIWLSITGYGRTAPERDWIAFGDDAAIAAGLGWAPSADTSAPPRFCADAVADPLTGLHAAVAAAAHWQAGLGGLLDVSLAGVVACAAQQSAGPLSLPICRNAAGWSIEAPSGRIAVASPRARAPHRKGPALSPPKRDTLEAWRHAC